MIWPWFVEVSQWTLQADRALAETYIGGGIPVCTGFSISAIVSSKHTLQETASRPSSQKTNSLIW